MIAIPKKIPRTCYECDSDLASSIGCDEWLFEEGKEKRSPDCPLIDIITCKDCNRSGTDGENTFCMWLGALRKPTDFCSYGERRE